MIKKITFLLILLSNLHVLKAMDNLEKESIFRDEKISFSFALARAQGNRTSMQDRNFPDTPETSPEIIKNIFFFGVYDGHNTSDSDDGAQCAEYSATYLHKNITTSPHFLSGDFKQALIDGYIKADEDFCKLEQGGGTTAATLLFEKSNLWIANVGDSEIIACLDGTKAVTLTQKHWPKDPDELDRILCKDGQVIIQDRYNIITYEQDSECRSIHTPRSLKRRIKSLITQYTPEKIFLLEEKFAPSARMSWKNSGRSLAVSRAIGDSFYKPLCIAEPFVQSIQISQPGFAILASDGLWDFITPQAAIDFVRHQLEKHQVLIENASREIIKEITHDLVKTVLRIEDSHDNITAMIIFFWPELTHSKF